jgi:uncharacterized SAM-binding protein YcdF (DUF218 family)
LYIYLSKLLPLLVMPVGIVFLLGLLALALLLWGKRKLSATFLAAALAVLWISSMPIVANTLYGRLERIYPPVPIESIPQSDCIVLLGGAVGPALRPRVDIELNAAIDRVYKAAELFLAYKGNVVIVAAGNQPWAAPGPPEAELIAELLVEWGVPRVAILSEGESRNTRENALNSKRLIELLACDSTLLVTSAAHMPRSVAAFEKVGVEVFPVSTDVRVAGASKFTVFDLLPHAGALSMTTDAMREWLGQKVYQFRGWM